MPQLIFSTQTPLLAQVPIGDIQPIKGSNDSITLSVRQGRHLLGYMYDQASQRLVYRWNSTIFSISGDYPLSRYPWYIAHKLLSDKDIIVLQHPDGVRLYQLDGTNSGLSLLKEDVDFHEGYGYTLLFGRFYPHTDSVGVMAHKTQGEIEFRVINQNSFLPDGEDDILLLLDVDLSLPPPWRSPDTDFFLTHLDHKAQAHIGSRSNLGLEFHQFNSRYTLDSVFNTSNLAKPSNLSKDRLFFGDLTHQKYQDILHLNDSGLYLYQYHNALKDYRAIHHNDQFSKSYNWLPQYSDTIKLFDVNTDGRDDLLFTGSKGLTALSFNVNTSSWDVLLDPAKLGSAQRYSKVVGILPAMPAIKTSKSTLFIQSADLSSLFLATVTEDRTTVTQAPLRVNLTTPEPVTTSSAAAPTVREDGGVPLIPIRSHSTIPRQISRTLPGTKPILQWGTGLHSSLFKQAVDSQRGSVRFSLPLINHSVSLTLGINLSLFYNSKSPASTFLGQGWHLPVGQDCILVAHQGSIYPEDARYYLMLDGSLQELRLQNSTSQGIQHFKLASTDQQKRADVSTITYEASTERWVIHDTVSKAVYGKSRDALQYSLAWPHWRGIGDNVATQTSLITAWYLNSHTDIYTNQTLYYTYEQDSAQVPNGKSYTAAIRLKSITGGNQTTLQFNYAAKSIDEYTKPYPINAQGNIQFPVSLASSHYLADYSLITDRYQQTLRFNYQIQDKNRVLTSITQDVAHRTSETVLQFNYQDYNGHSLLNRCTLPNHVTVDFEYSAVTPAAIPIAHHKVRFEDNKLMYDVWDKDRVKIASGPDYAVIAYSSSDSVLGKQIALEITNLDMTHSLVNYKLDTGLSCITEPTQIIDFLVQPYQNSFIIHVKTEASQKLYFFKRRVDRQPNGIDSSLWITQPTVHSFSKEAIIRLNPALIAAGEPSHNQLQVLTFDENQSDWHNTTLSLPENTIAISTYQKRIVCASDRQLQLFYLDDQSAWQSKVIKDNLSDFGPSNARNIVNHFDSDTEVKEQFITHLDQHSLYSYNNLIVLQTLNLLNDHKLVHKAYLWLLDESYNLVKEAYITLGTEDILRKDRYQMVYDRTNGASMAHIAYVLEDGLFKAKVTKVSGKRYEDIKKLDLPRPRIEDAVNKEINSLNDHAAYKAHFKKQVFFGKYPIQITPQGIYYLNDAKTRHLIRFSGDGWQSTRELLTRDSIPLGDHFILESEFLDLNTITYRLYKQGENKTKEGSAIQIMRPPTSGQFINLYPAYIAYQDGENKVVVLPFKEGKAVAPALTFSGEQLSPYSNAKYIITLSSAASNLNLRPLSTLIPAQPEHFATAMEIKAGELSSRTAYTYAFASNQQELTYTKKVETIPTGDKTYSGWYEESRIYHVNDRKLTTNKLAFNATGIAVPIPGQSENENQSENNRSDVGSTRVNPSLLVDKTGQLRISNFSPYRLVDEMVAYYGFESYESNKIGASKSWRMSKAQVMEQGFSFTGQNYLQLDNAEGADEATPAFIEGVFAPRSQKLTYLASCWVRTDFDGPTALLLLNEPSTYFKAILSTDSGHEIMGFKATVKQQIDDWSYLEVLIDFQLMREIYKRYLGNPENSAILSTLPSVEEVSFTLTLRAEVAGTEKLAIDHIRFMPLHHDFQATVYDPIQGHPTGIIQANGRASKLLYNSLDQEIASLDEYGQLEHLTSASKTGTLALVQHRDDLSHHPDSSFSFKPEQGFYETFSPYALRSRWNLDHADAWHIAQGQLWHKTQDRHQIQADHRLFQNTSSALRFHFALEDHHAALSLHWQDLWSLQLVRKQGRHHRDHVEMILPDNTKLEHLPSAGELIVILEHNHLLVLVDGVLVYNKCLSNGRDAKSLMPWSAFYFQAKGQVLVEDLLVMHNPYVQAVYYNKLGEKTQSIQLESPNSVIVTETLYDALGRAAITTKPARIARHNATQSILSYRRGFVTNSYLTAVSSVWETGVLQGEIARLHPDDKGFSYSRTQYAKTPLQDKQVVGQAGQTFSIKGPFAKHFSQDSKIAFLSNLFPKSSGYLQQVERLPNGSRKVAIFDKAKNKVALYVRVDGWNHLLTTYEYNAENRLIKTLPPLYHEQVGTSSQLTPWQFGEAHLSAEEKQLQQSLGTHLTYDVRGNLIRKVTPDRGIVDYLYNADGRMRFMVSSTRDNQTHQVVYFDYDDLGQLIHTGYLDDPLPATVLRYYVTGPLPRTAVTYQRLRYSDAHPDPLLRGNIKQILTYNGNGSIALVEELQFNNQQQVKAKRTFALPGQIDANLSNDIEKRYLSGRLHVLIYPVTINGQPLHLVHSYNKKGQLTGLGLPNHPTYYGSFSHHADGQLAVEQHQPHNHTLPKFIRNYLYNSPGFLEQIADPFLTESITYTTGGYGQSGFGDGIIMQTAFNASWPKNVDPRWFQLEAADIPGNYSAICLEALKRTGYISHNRQPVQLYMRALENGLPLVCGGDTARHLARLVAEKQPPVYYGYHYAYGNHQELVKAKYFTEETKSFSKPLQPTSFKQAIPNLTRAQYQEIWNLLKNGRYILTYRQRNDPDTVVGRRGESFFRAITLFNDLKNLTNSYTRYTEPIKKLIITAISQRKSLSLADFTTAFLHWKVQGLIYKGIAEEIGKMLIDKGYLPATSTITDLYSALRKLDQRFTEILAPYNRYIPEILQVLLNHFAHSLGETAFDLVYYDIDANGNHHSFYSGFNLCELTYRNRSNQVQAVRLNMLSALESKPIVAMAYTSRKDVIWTTKSLPRQVFDMAHDAQGNVIKALHKGINRITYHPVSQRTTSIELTDGRRLNFAYDAKGERVFKRVLNAGGQVSLEKHYLRDEEGRVLVERQTNYLYLTSTATTEKTTTAYLYGPRGLLGFIRNDVFYNIITDHAGSIRLVVKDNEVVAAYDYMPYGTLMRAFGNDPQAHIAYRYTGQEWDEETGLYNYHARLYDPAIGRFYQTDPKEQYHSPYKYAGNSPISLVDPDGQVAWMIILPIIAIAIPTGAYLGGAAVNNRWNPAEWDFSHRHTWFAIGGGALSGALAPLGVGTSVGLIGVYGTIAVSAGVGYISVAAAHGGNFAFWEWEYTRPGTWNALFEGATTGAGLFGGIGAVRNFAKFKVVNGVRVARFSSTGRKIFYVASTTAGTGIMYVSASAANEWNFAFWNWDTSNPAATLITLINGFDSGFGLPQNFAEVGRGTLKNFKNPVRLGSLRKFKSILKNPKHPMYKLSASVAMAYYMGSAANQDFINWENSFTTYQGVLNGMFFGKDAKNLWKAARDVYSKPVELFSKKIDSLVTKSIKQLAPFLVPKITEIVDRLILLHNTHNTKYGSRYPETFTKTQDELKQEWKKKQLSWQKEIEAVSQKRKEIVPDRDATFLGCGTRRRKRSSQSCNIASISNQIIDQRRGSNPGNIVETYPASGLKLTLHGNAYQLKLNALFLKRGLDAGYQFKLSTEMDAAEKFDDLVFKYVKNGKTFYTFLQAKHKQTDSPDNNKKITKSDLFNTSDGEFSLPKYLESYLKISNNVQFRDSNNKNFILSTNIGFDLDLGSASLIKIESTEYANKGLDFLSTKDASEQEIGEMYRLDIQSNDYDKLREGSDFNTLARELAKHLLKGEKMDLRNTIFKEYHVALVEQDIIDLSTKKLHTRFKETTASTVKDFREAFVKEALSLKKNKKAIFKDESELWMAIQDKSFQCTNAFGKPKQGQNTDLPAKVTDKQIKDFLDALIFSVKQPNEITLGKLFTKKIGNDNNLLDADLQASYILAKVFDWFKEKKGTFLTKEAGEELFNQANRKKSSLVSYGTTIGYTQKLKKYGVKFNGPIARDFLKPDGNKRILVVSTKDTELSALKIYQELSTNDNFKQDDSYIFVKLSDLKNKVIEEIILNAFGSDKSNNLLVINLKDGKIDDALYLKLSQIANNKKIILIGEQGKLVTSDRIIQDTKLKFNDLEDASKYQLLKKAKIKFQGKDISLSKFFSESLIDANVNTLLDALPLSKLLKDEEIIIDNQSSTSSSANSDKIFYQDRTFIDANAREESSNTFINTVLQPGNTGSNIVLIADRPGMGKTTMLIQLTEQIKENRVDDPYWVVNVRLKDHMQALEKLKTIENDDMTKDQAIQFITDGLLSLHTQDKALDLILFDHLADRKRIVLMLDGVDEVGGYTDQTIKLLKALKDDRIGSMVITTRPHPRIMKKFKQELGVDNSYTLKPFSKEQQVEFLTKFWEVGVDPNQMQLDDRAELMQKFAGDLLKKFTQSITEDRHGFTGTPLQIRMLADVYQEDVKNHLKGDRNEILTPPENTELLDLYNDFYNSKLSIFNREKISPTINKNEENTRHLIQQNELITHQELALEELFTKEYIETFRDSTDWFNNPELTLEQLAQVGMIEVVDDQPHFIHQTFSEYFAANFINDKLRSISAPDEFKKFVLTEVLAKEEHYMIRAFLDKLLDKSPLDQNIKQNQLNRIMGSYGTHLDEIYQNQISKEIQRDDPRAILHLAAEEGNNNIIDFLYKSLAQGDPITLKGLLLDLPTIYDPSRLTALDRAVIGNHITTVEKILDLAKSDPGTLRIMLTRQDQFGRTILNYSIIKNSKSVRNILETAQGNTDILRALLLAQDNSGVTALHDAVKFGNKEAVQYILDAARSLQDKTLQEMLSQKDKYGKTALDSANKKGSETVINLLNASMDNLSLGDKRPGDNTHSEQDAKKNKPNGRKRRHIVNMTNLINNKIYLEETELSNNIESKSNKYVEQHTNKHTNTSIDNLLENSKAAFEQHNCDPIGSVASGASRIEFWPTSLIKKAGKAVSSIFSSNWLSSSKEKVHEDLPARSLLQSKPLIEQQPLVKAREVNNTLLEAHLDPSAYQQPPFNASPTGPTLLEMGDQWVQSTDVNGLLTWATLLARKCTGYRPKAPKAQPYDPGIDKNGIGILSSIRSHELVNAFIDKVQEQSKVCGIEASDILDNAKLYTQSIETVRKQLATGQVDTIVDTLFEQVVQKNISKIASKSTSDQANQLLTSIKEDLPNFQQEFLRQEVSPKLKSCAESLTHSISSMPQNGQVANNILRIDNTYNTSNTFVQNSLYHGTYRKCASL